MLPDCFDHARARNYQCSGAGLVSTVRPIWSSPPSRCRPQRTRHVLYCGGTQMRRPFRHRARERTIPHPALRAVARSLLRWTCASAFGERSVHGIVIRDNVVISVRFDAGDGGWIA